MGITDRLSVESISDAERMRLPILLVALPTVLGIAHHVDHVVRGNHVGWPLTPEVNAFTYSLAIYPLIAFGVYLTATDRVGVGYWAGLLAASTVVLAFVHVGPWAIEPPADIVLPYTNPAVGYLAFGVVLALIASVGLGAAYATVLWWRNRL